MSCLIRLHPRIVHMLKFRLCEYLLCTEEDIKKKYIMFTLADDDEYHDCLIDRYVIGRWTDPVQIAAVQAIAPHIIGSGMWDVSFHD
jgi:hypothetical protein